MLHRPVCGGSDVDALLTVGSTSDASLDALAGAMAEGASAAGCASHIDWCTTLTRPIVW